MGIYVEQKYIISREVLDDNQISDYTIVEVAGQGMSRAIRVIVWMTVAVPWKQIICPWDSMKLKSADGRKFVG